MKLYNLESCPFCAMVRKKLADLALKYVRIEVPPARTFREEVFKVSGQYTVPVLVDGETVLADEYEIIAYLEARYGKNSGKE